ncbi:MAG: AraC family transcriptional regulator [Gemmatimonadota bacterium]|nr:AraC family transcriptional regulator [Gemmatimonadota bacterium]
MPDHCFGAHEASVRGDRLLVSRTVHAPALRTPPHSHSAMCLHLVLRGLYDEHTRSGHHQVEPGETLFKPSEEVHWNEFRGEGAVTLRIELEPEAFPALTELLPARLASFRSPRLAALGRRAHRELGVTDELTPIVVESIALEMCAVVARLPTPDGVEGRSLARRCSTLLEARYREPYRLADVARDLGVDRTVLARAFRSEFDCTVGEFIRARRVEHVASRLSDPDRSLGELAIEAGFADQSHMTRCFRSVYGLPPGAWRRTGITPRG